MTESPTIHRSAPLALRLLARRRPPARAGGLRLARLVIDRRRVDRVLDATVRLSRGRTRTWSPPSVADARIETALSVPEDSLAAEGGDLMSWWLDADEPPLGHPDELAAMYMDPAERRAPRPASGVARRGVVHEVSGAGDERKPDRFRVSRSPEPPASAPAPERVPEPEPVERATPRAPAAAPDTATPVPEPTAPVAVPVPTEGRPTRPVVARAQARPASIPARPAVVPRARVSAPAPAATPPATAIPTQAMRTGAFPRLLGKLAGALRPRSRAPEAKPAVRPEPASRGSRPDPVRATPPKAPEPADDVTHELPQPVDDEPAAVAARGEDVVAAEQAPLEPAQEAPSEPPGQVEAEPTRPALRVSRSPLPDRGPAKPPEQPAGRQGPGPARPTATSEPKPSAAPVPPQPAGPAAPTTHARDAVPPEPPREAPEPSRAAAPPDADQETDSPPSAARPTPSAARSGDEPAAAEPAPRRPVVVRRAEPASSRPLPRETVARVRVRTETAPAVHGVEPSGRLRRLLRRVGVPQAAPGRPLSEPAVPGNAKPVAVEARPAPRRWASAPHESPPPGADPETPAQVLEPARQTELKAPASRPLLRRALGRQAAAGREPETRPAPAPALAPAQSRPTGAASRPQIRVARRPAAAPTLARTPRTPSGSSAESLAAATGAAISHEPDGTAAITFHDEPARPQRPAPFAGPAPTIARATGPAGPTLARASTPSSGGGDAYEDFVERLRRDLLREREQVGDLLGDKSW